MINLIPNKEKKEMVKGFRYRLVVLFLIVGAFCFLIVLIAILPAFFLSVAKDNIINAKLEEQKSEPVPLLDQQTLAVIKDLDNKLSIVENDTKNKFAVSEKVINAIMVKKMPEIKLNDIFYENKPASDPKGGRKISIQGTAPSREILLLFRQALEDSTNFKQVDLPISNFIKGSDIQFSLSLIPS
ncbi:MAG TPA: hypothetical protein VK675_00115 [Candidatus Paceibacterota bacterium]|nr:hypothetical protein [Candidatus Paceibacterota bacterium]